MYDAKRELHNSKPDENKENQIMMKFFKFVLGVAVIGIIVVVVIVVIEDGGEQMTASELDCVKLAKEIEGEELQNAFGMKTKVMKVSDVKQLSRSETELTCNGIAMLNTGKEKMNFSYFSDSDGDWFMQMSTAE